MSDAGRWLPFLIRVPKRPSHASRRRRESLQIEAREQMKLQAMLEKWLPCFCTMIENRPRSAMAGMFQRRRGCKSGFPDCYVLHSGRPIHIELKSPIGVLSKVQRQRRLELLANGAIWWLCRSANAAMVALSRSGVEFRMVVNSRGVVEAWQAPRLQPWEEPTQNPSMRHPAPPELRIKRREAKRRYRAGERQRLQVQQGDRGWEIRGKSSSHPEAEQRL